MFVEKQLKIIEQENKERELREKEEKLFIKELVESRDDRSKDADILIPQLIETGDDLAIKWAEMAKKAPTHFILSNCKRVLRDVRRQQELGRQMK